MELDNLIDAIRSIVTIKAASCGDSSRLLRAVEQVRLVRSWLDSIEVSLTGQLLDCDPFPETNLAKASRSTRRHVDDLVRRHDTVGKAPLFGAAMAAGAISGEHVDVLGRALTGAAPEIASRLLAQAGDLVAIAAAANTDEFARTVRRRIHALEADGGASRQQRQQRATRLRW